MNKELLDRVIESNTVKNWIYSNNFKFSCEELVSLIYNSELTLDEKRDLLVNNFRSQYELEQAGCTNAEYIISEVDKIVSSIDWINESLTGIRSRAVMYDIIVSNSEETGIITRTCCAKSLNNIKRIINNDGNTLYNNNLTIISLKDSKELAYIRLNDDLQVIDYSVPEDNKMIETSKLQSYFVDIPMEFEIGDIVVVAGDPERYVVCYDNVIPDNLKKKCDFMDSCITVVPESILDKNKSYKQQINDILASRIREIQFYRDAEQLDIISKYHEHICITLVEKV